MSWESRAINFVIRTSDVADSITAEKFMQYAIDTLREMTASYTSLLICLEDAYSVKVKHAIPVFLEDILLNAEHVSSYLNERHNNIIFWKDNQLQDNPFEDVLLALSSAVFIPITDNGQTNIILLGWSDSISFDESFRQFMNVVQVRMKEILRQTSTIQKLQYTQGIFHSIAVSLPDAVVFIDNSHYKAWINEEAAILLKLPQQGHMQPATVSAAMSQLRTSLVNKEEVDNRAIEIFSSPTGVHGWLWETTDGLLAVSCLRITGDTSGILWIFRRSN